jgi:hypothetical protein
MLTLHHHIGRTKPHPFQEKIEIGPLEHQFGHMVHLCLLKQVERSDCRKRIFAGQGLGIVVEVNDIGFPEA